MKKLLFLMLSAAVAVSASAGITSTKIGKTITKESKDRTERLTRASGKAFTGKAISEFKGWAERPVMFRGSSYTWDFEDTTQLQGWSIIDADGDGYYWNYSDTILTAHSGNCCLFSNSYVNSSTGSGGTALTPDNWLISPEVTLGGGVEVWAVGQDPNYAAEVFAIYVAVGEPTSTDDFVKVSPDFTTTGEYARYSADLSAYEGQTGCFAIRHYNVTDQFILNIDDIRIAPDVEVEHYPTVPTNLAVAPGSDYANVTWDGQEEDNWNLRWRPYVDTSGNPINVTLPYATYEEELEGWAILDVDQDGNGWGLAFTDSEQTDLCFKSDSYSGGALTPDNWLISPLTKLEGVCTFKTAHRSTYPEKMEVMIGMEDAIEGNTVDIDAFTTIKSITTTGNDFAETTVDLSSYNGEKGYVVFRHYGTTDQWTLYLDDIFIGDPNAEIVEPAAWIYPEENPMSQTNYTITGLTPETTYEVQVQTVYEDTETAWTDIVTFTTLAEENNVYILGEVGEQNWAPNAGVQMTYDEENNVYVATVTFDGRNNEDGAEVNYFAFTKKLGLNGDDWATCNANRFGSETDGDFWVTPELMGQELGLVFPYEMSYRIAKGEYKMTVDLENMTLVIEDLTPPAPQGLRGDVNDDTQVTIADVSALIDYLLTEDATGINLGNADCNLDEGVTIADVSALIDYLLTETWGD